jgi:drug/metabolite transporter (DMT)-like permease
MNKAIRVANVTYYTMMNMLVPVINGIMGIMLLNESINLIQIVGGVILLISGILVQKLRA